MKNIKINYFPVVFKMKNKIFTAVSLIFFHIQNGGELVSGERVLWHKRG